MKNTTNNTIYCAIVGSNGYGVYTNQPMARKSRSYLYNFHWKTFSTFEQACQWAHAMFIILQPDGKSCVHFEPITQLNWCYHAKKQ